MKYEVSDHDSFIQENPYKEEKYWWTPKSVMESPHLRAIEKIVFGYIIDKDPGWRFSAERIARTCKEGEDTIKKALQRLEALNLIRRQKHVTGRMAYTVIKPKKTALDPASIPASRSTRYPTRMF